MTGWVVNSSDVVFVAVQQLTALECCDAEHNTRIQTGRFKTCGGAGLWGDFSAL